MEELTYDEIMDFINDKFEDLNGDSKESILNYLEDGLSDLRDDLELK